MMKEQQILNKQMFVQEIKRAILSIQESQKSQNQPPINYGSNEHAQDRQINRLILAARQQQFHDELAQEIYQRQRRDM